MVECDYCDAEFATEDRYLAHLRDAHEGELRSIDQRRVDNVEGDGGLSLPTGPAVLGILLVGALALVVYVTVFAGAGGSESDVTGLPNRGDQAVISQVQTEPASSNAHVAQGSEIAYETVPPTGGPHYPTPANAGFYEQPHPYGALVHSIEHGAIVVYYDPARLSSSAEEQLRSYAQAFTGPWRGFIAVPNPEQTPSAYVLTAWEKRLTLDEYDENAVRQFTAEYLGRGPENPVRPTDSQ